MATEKVFLQVLLFLILILPAEGIDAQDSDEYKQTSGNFLDTNVTNFISIKDAVDFTANLTESDITKAERKFKKDIPIWKVDLITKEGGTLKIEISAIDKSLIRIDAAEGPFEYEIKPFTNLISFSEAQKKAEEYTGLKTLKWNLFKNKNNWEYNFWLFIKSGKAQVRVDAETGEIVTGKKKKKN